VIPLIKVKKTCRCTQEVVYVCEMYKEQTNIFVKHYNKLGRGWGNHMRVNCTR
jgi:hypothetical protein